MMLYQTIFLALFAVARGGLVVVQQNGERQGTIEQISNLGEIKLKSSLSFKFSWPLIQMTADKINDEVYIVTYPDGSPGPMLYNLDNQMNLVKNWTQTPFSFFDLQFSQSQNTLYGIYVSSTYGRVLSNFTAALTSDSVEVDQLFTLPYMWYVNASSFNSANCNYFALINNFPGKENSTLDQQLIVADFSESSKVKEPEVKVMPISNPNGILQFIAYAKALDTLFYAGMIFNESVVELGSLDQETGKIQKQYWTRPAVAAGPLVANEQTQSLMVFVKSLLKADTWQLWSIPYGYFSLSAEERDVSSSNRPRVVLSYTGAEYKYFAAAVAL